MITRTLTGKLVDARRQPLVGLQLTFTPDLPRSGMPYPADNEVVVPAPFTTTTDADGVFTMPNMLVTDAGPFQGWFYTLSFPYGSATALPRFSLPSGAGTVDLADIMAVETTDGWLVVGDASTHAAAAAASATTASNASNAATAAAVSAADAAAAAAVSAADAAAAAAVVGQAETVADVSLGSGFVTAGTTPKARKAAGWAWLTGSVKRTSGTGTTMLTVPAGYRPLYTRTFQVATEGASSAAGPAATITITTAGVVTVSVLTGVTWTTNTWFYLPEIPYRIV